MRRPFLSHSRRDADLAAGIARALRKLGVESFEALKSFVPEEDYRSSTKAAIRRADAFILVLSAPESAASSWVSYELGMAEALAKPVLLLLSDNHAADQLPSDLVGLPIVPLDPTHPELAAREIVARLMAST